MTKEEALKDILVKCRPELDRLMFSLIQTYSRQITIESENQNFIDDYNCDETIDIIRKEIDDSKNRMLNYMKDVISS